LRADKLAREFANLHKAGFLNRADDKRAQVGAGALRLFAGKFDVDTSSQSTSGKSSETAN